MIQTTFELNEFIANNKIEKAYKIVKPTNIHFTRGQETQNPELLYGIICTVDHGFIFLSGGNLYYYDMDIVEEIDNDMKALGYWMEDELLCCTTAG